MLLKKNLLLISFIGAFSFLQAQTNPTGKMVLVKKYTFNAVAVDNVEFTISKTGDNINVTARGSKAKVKANNSLRGIIIFGSGVAENFGSTDKVGVSSVKVVLGKDPGGQPVKSTTVGADGKFEFTDVPAGTYQVLLGGKLIATGLKIRGE